MTFLQWLTFLGVTIGVRWVAIHWLPGADAYLLAGLVLGYALLAIYRRTRHYALADLRNRGPAPGLGETLAESSAIGSTDASAPLQPLSGNGLYVYPAGSRVLSVLGLLFSSLFAIGFLAPVAFGSIDDPANGWVLFVLGLAMLGFALLRASLLHWLGTTLLISPEGLTYTGHFATVTHLPWAAVSRVTTQRFPTRIALMGTDGKVIYVYPQLCGFRMFIAAAVRALDAAHGAS